VAGSLTGVDEVGIGRPCRLPKSATGPDGTVYTHVLGRVAITSAEVAAIEAALVANPGGSSIESQVYALEVEGREAAAHMDFAREIRCDKRIAELRARG
jgi:hypothetical protein